MPRSVPQPDGATGLVELAAQLAGTAGIGTRELTEIVEAAILETYHRLVDEDPAVRVRVDLAQGTQEIVAEREGGEEVLPPLTGDAARQAAQAVRAAVAERIRRAGAERTLNSATEQRGELIDAVVERRRGRTWVLRAGASEVELPPEEQAADEDLRMGQHLKVVVLEGRRRGPDAVMLVSRSHPQLLRLLLAQEVPEIGSGQVVIREVAREAGRRSKVAVDTTDPDIDPQGACIGPKGVRHRAVTGELGSEQLQIVRWSEDPATLVANSLVPAPVLGVELDPESRTAHVRVDPSVLSLAIGRGGENARLAARLTGWRIDIAGDGA